MAPDPSREREGERRRLTWCDTCQGPWLSLRFCSHPKQQGTRRPTSWTSPRRCSKCRRGKERPRRTRTRSGLLSFAGGWKGTRREDRPKCDPFLCDTRSNVPSKAFTRVSSRTSFPNLLPSSIVGFEVRGAYDRFHSHPPGRPDSYRAHWARVHHARFPPIFLSSFLVHLPGFRWPVCPHPPCDVRSRQEDSQDPFGFFGIVGTRHPKDRGPAWTDPHVPAAAPRRRDGCGTRGGGEGDGGHPRRHTNHTPLASVTKHGPFRAEGAEDGPSPPFGTRFRCRNRPRWILRRRWRNSDTSNLRVCGWRVACGVV